MGNLQRIGRFYTRIIMKNIGLFLFIGLLSVVFHENGWLPNERMYSISQIAYVYAVPLLVAYEGGAVIGGNPGGVLAVLGVCGFVALKPEIGLFGAMLYAPLGGWIWSRGEAWLEKRVSSSMQMLVKNLMVGIVGSILAGAAFYIAAPFLELVIGILFRGVQFLVEENLTGILSVVIEPAKVLFLNNLVNHGVLIPLGMRQAQELGRSVLFLLETNPGPGFGVLFALYLSRKKERNAYISAMFAEAVGGIHEVYFPFVLSDMKLLIPLVLGGMAGGFWFNLMQCGLAGAGSPGSVLVITVLAGKQSGLVAIGILISAAVSFMAGTFILRGEKEKYLEEKKREEKEVSFADIKTVGCVCDGGMGSSAMGAALLRKVLGQKQIMGIEVKAFAADMIPEGVDLLICQKNFYQLRSDWQTDRRVYVVDNFVNRNEYEELAEKLQKAKEE